jgi:hypothetical protein
MRESSKREMIFLGERKKICFKKKENRKQKKKTEKKKK